MKTLSLFLLTILLNIFPAARIFSQCAGNTVPFTLTYDTIVYGNGNASRNFSFPKFDPAAGTLLMVDLKSVVSLGYSYTLENQTSIDTTFKTKIIRTDDIGGTALDPDPISVVNQTALVSSFIQSHQLLSFGPKRMNYTISNSVSDGRMINFMGAGSVGIDYETGSSASVQGPLPWQLNFTSVTDTTRFSITYRYCSSTLLSADLMFFTAIAQGKNTVLLNWRQAIIEGDRLYNLQVSTDGQHFTTVAVVKENASGAYAYTYLNNSAKTLFFRIEQKNTLGEVKYSNIRTVTLEQQLKPGVQVHPSLYTGGNLQVNFPERGDWQITIYAADGRKVTGSRAQNASGTSLQLSNRFTNGVYIVETVNTHSQQRDITRIVVQR